MYTVTRKDAIDTKSRERWVFRSSQVAKTEVADNTCPLTWSQYTDVRPN